MKRLQGRKFRQPVADTLQVHEWMQDQSRGSRGQYDACEENKDLFSLAKKYHIQVSAAHNALMDAFITAQLFQRFLSSSAGARRQDREGPAADRETLGGGGERKKHLKCSIQEFTDLQSYYRIRRRQYG